MASRFENYTQRVGVEDAGSFRPVLPEIGDPGRAISSLGETLLKTAEPTLKAKAEREAIEAAGVASIVKVGDGFQPGEPIPRGAGAVYAKVYNEAMDARLRQQTVKAFEAGLAQMQDDLRDDPELFYATAEGTMRGVLAATAPAIRADVEVDLLREISERHRGLAEAKGRQEELNFVNGQNDLARESVAEAIDIAKVGGPEWRTRAQIPARRAERAYELLHEAGKLDDNGLAAARLSIRNLLGPQVREAGDRDTFAGFGAIIGGMDNDNLKRMTHFALGNASDGQPLTYTDGEGKTKTVTYEQFTQLIQTPEVRALAGRMAADVLGDRLAAERAALEEQRERERVERENRLIQTAEETLAATRDLNYDPGSGLSKEQVAGVEGGLAAHGPIFTQMQTPEGRARIKSVISTTGYLPKGVKEAIDAQITGGNFEAVIEFAQDIRGYHHNGVAVGELAIGKLSAEARATIALDETLRRGGMKDATQRFDTLRDARGKRSYTDAEAQAIYPKGGYPKAREAAIAGAFGGTVKGNPIIRRDYDELFAVNLQLANGDAARASKATAEMVANAWAPSPTAIGGVIPRKLRDSMAAMGVAWRHIGAVAAAEAGMTSPEVKEAVRAARFRVQSEDDNNGNGHGRWTLHAFDARGRKLPSFKFEMDDVFRRLEPHIRKARAASNLAARRAVIAKGSKWVSRGDRYITREQALAEFDEANK